MLTRKRYREVPPRVDYELTERARELMPILGELARWGYEWAWSAPRANEAVDIGAIFRLAPGLVRTGPGTEGSVELSITKNSGDGVSYTMSVSDGIATVEERTAERSDARVSGDESAWIAAFAPDGTRAGLTVTGDRALADILLNALASGEGRSSAGAGADTVAA
jgi:hypothetical protein